DSNIPSGLGSATTLVAADAEAIQREVAGVKRQTPVVRLRGWIDAGAQHRFYGQILGVDVALPGIYGWSFARGRFFDASPVAARGAVAVVGSTVRERLFDDDDPVGKTITIRNRAFSVVGAVDTGDEDQSE